MFYLSKKKLKFHLKTKVLTQVSNGFLNAFSYHEKCKHGKIYTLIDKWFGTKKDQYYLKSGIIPNGRIYHKNNIWDFEYFFHLNSD